MLPNLSKAASLKEDLMMYDIRTSPCLLWNYFMGRTTYGDSHPHIPLLKVAAQRWVFIEQCAWCCLIVLEVLLPHRTWNSAWKENTSVSHTITDTDKRNPTCEPSCTKRRACRKMCPNGEMHYILYIHNPSPENHQSKPKDFFYQIISVWLWSIISKNWSLLFPLGQYWQKRYISLYLSSL